MKMLLATAAALSIAALASGPAATQSRTNHGVTVHSGSGFVAPGDLRGSFDRRLGRSSDLVVGGEWALYNNRTFEPDSYNDWWHERTWRSYPRWMTSSNRSCDRLWWGGGVWRCGW